MKSVKEAFNYFGGFNKGYLTSHELKCCVIYLTGTKPSKVTMKKLKETTSEFTIQDIYEIAGSQTKPDSASEIFSALDAKNKGFITLEDFHNLCNTHLKHMKTNIRESIFSEIDSNKDGMVTLRDIQRLVKFETNS